MEDDLKPANSIRTESEGKYNKTMLINSCDFFLNKTEEVAFFDYTKTDHGNSTAIHMKAFGMKLILRDACLLWIIEFNWLKLKDYERKMKKFSEIIYECQRMSL